MRYKNYLLLMLGVFFASITFAQVKVNGTVKSKADNQPLPGVTVLLKGTTKGTVTDLNGNFEIQADSLGQKVVFSFIGMKTTEVPASSGMNVSLEEGVQLDEFVITALGFEANKDELGAAQTTIDGTALENSGETRLINNLAGKSAGVNIVQSTGDPGAGSKIQIRGATSITGDLEPLVVIDGVPMFNDSYYGEAFGGNLSGSSGSLGSGGGVTQQSRLNDINPDDIESVQILRGASAAALWGSRAANGVIMITTKKGKSGGSKDFVVNVSSAVSLDRVNRKIDLNDKYGQGSNMIYTQGAPTGFGRSLSWGDKIEDRSGGSDTYITDVTDPNYMGYFDSEGGKRYYRIADGDATNPSGGKNSTETYDIYDQLFKTGITLNNSVNVSQAGEKGTVFFSLSDLTQDGIIKSNSTLHKNTVRMNVTRRLGDKFKLSSNINYSRTNSDRVQMGSNLNGLFLGGLRNPADFNMEDYIGTYVDPDGNRNEDVPRAFRNALGANPGYGYDNPLWMMENSPSTNQVDRTMGKLELGYDPLDWLNLTLRGGWDDYTDSREDFFHEYSSGENNGGRFVKEIIKRTQLNLDLIARGNFTLTEDIGLNALIGTNINDRKLDDQAVDARTFVNPLSPPQLNNSGSSVLYNEEEHERTIGYYTTLSFDLYDQLFVNLSGRYDLLSTLPKDDNAVFYPAADIAWQFHQFIPESTKISFAKLRVGYGQVGRGPDPYSLSTVFISPTAAITGFGEGWGPGVNPVAYGGGFVQTNVAGNPELKPEIKTEFEVGTDLRFLEDRLSASFTYYNNTTTDLIIQGQVATSTGFQEQLVNGAEIENKGIELELGADIIKKKDFEWSAYGNYTKNTNEVTDMGGASSILLAGFSGTSSRAVLGEQLGVLWGAKWERDGAGNMVLDDNGFPTQAEESGVIGDPNPDFRMGIGNEFTYKNWSMSFLFDAAVGMDMWNGTKGALAFFGRAGYTTTETTLSADQAQSLKVFAFDTDGNALTVADVYGHAQNSDGSYTVRGEIDNFGGGDVFLDENWYTTGPGSGFTGPDEQFVEDASWYRFREFKLAYNLGQDKLNNFLGIDRAVFSFSINNVFLWTDYDGNDPDQSLNGPGNNGFGLDYFQNPSTRTYRLGVNLTF